MNFPPNLFFAILLVTNVITCNHQSTLLQIDVIVLRFRLCHQLYNRALIIALNSQTGLSSIRKLTLHEKEVVNFIKTLQGELSIDIGANWGYFTVLLSRRFRKVIAIEPHPITKQLLHRNTEDLGKITYLHMVISDENGVRPSFVS